MPMIKKRRNGSFVNALRERKSSFDLNGAPPSARVWPLKNMGFRPIRKPFVLSALASAIGRAIPLLPSAQRGAFSLAQPRYRRRLRALLWKEAEESRNRHHFEWDKNRFFARRFVAGRSLR